jgi:hypothetical protein
MNRPTLASLFALPKNNTRWRPQFYGPCAKAYKCARTISDHLMNTVTRTLALLSARACSVKRLRLALGQSTTQM